MRHLSAGPAIAAALLGASPTFAAYTTSPTVLAGGVLAVLNTTTGTISICYRFGSQAPRCVAVGTFASPSASTRIIANEGGLVFYISDSASGRTMRCDQSGNVTALSSGWTCLLVAPTLP